MKIPSHILRSEENQLHFESLNQSGIFPASLDFYAIFDPFYVEHLKHLDSIGISSRLITASERVLVHFALSGKPIDYLHQEPDRSTPSDENNCYLPYFRGKKILLVCPFAKVLQERAQPEIYERVWSKIGKPWFDPHSVDALEFPYGFDPATHQRYATVLDLFEEIKEALTQRDFDIALIGAAGLAIPLASFVKSLGKVGLDLGGHLQILFGVLGQRWRNWKLWQARYFNEAWIDMPARYRPRQTDVCDAGAYW